MPRIKLPYKKHSTSNALQWLKTLSLIAVSFSLGTTITATKKLLQADLLEEEGRKLAQEHAIFTNSVTNTGSIRGHDVQVPRHGDKTNGRGWIHPMERDYMKERIQAVEQRLKSLQTNPPATKQSQPETLPERQQQQEENAISTDKKRPRTTADIKFCREQVFVTQQKPVEDLVLDRTCNRPEFKRFDVCHDLADFAGLTIDEVVVRMSRVEQFHFEEEHLFWNPQSTTELAWYYATSQSYLFANSIHAARTSLLDLLKKDIHEPVLDYSGGVGNNALYLAMERGMKCQYFGIGMIEKAFAQYRVAKRGLQHMVTVLNPWTEGTNWRFDPIHGPLPRNGTLGAIVADDVLEHIPNYHNVVAAMVDSIKVGGVIIERTPFAENPVSGENNNVDTRIHVHNGGISMKEAMGDRMVFREQEGYWEKIKA